MQKYECDVNLNEEASAGKTTRKNRNRAFTRRMRMKHITRKKMLIKAARPCWRVKADGMLSKGKIHCSCPMCRTKSYDYPKISDIRSSLKCAYTDE